MERHTYTRHTNRSGRFVPEVVTVTEFTFAELCHDEQREVIARHLPIGPDVRFSIGKRGVCWRRIRNQ